MRHPPRHPHDDQPIPRERYIQPAGPVPTLGQLLRQRPGRWAWVYCRNPEQHARNTAASIRSGIVPVRSLSSTETTGRMIIDFLYRWQTGLTGLLALFGGGAVVYQTWSQQKSERLSRRQKQEALKIGLLAELGMVESHLKGGLNLLDRADLVERNVRVLVFLRSVNTPLLRNPFGLGFEPSKEIAELLARVTARLTLLDDAVEEHVQAGPQEAGSVGVGLAKLKGNVEGVLGMVRQLILALQRDTRG